MRSTIFSVLVLGLSALAEATFSSPKSGDKWSKGSSQTISWDNSGMSSECDIHLVPSGAKDITKIITEIAISVSNSGSYSWTPDCSLSVTEAEIIIVDSKKSMIISSVFQFVSIDAYCSSGGGKGGKGYSPDYGNKGSPHKSNSSETKTQYGNGGNGHATETYEHSTKTYDHNSNTYEHSTKTYDHNTNTYEHSTKTYDHNTHTYEHSTETYDHNTHTYEHSTKTYEGSTTTDVVTIGISYNSYETSTSLTTIQVTTTVAGTLTTYYMTTSTALATVAPPAAVTTSNVLTTVAPPAAVTTSFALTTVAPPEAITTEAPPAYTSIAGNSSTTLAVNATPTAITFTGAAPSSESTFYGAAIACAVGFAAMLFL